MRLFYENTMNYEEINPWHKAVEQVSGESCQFVTRVQLLIVHAEQLAKIEGENPIDLIFEAVNYLVKQETKGAPLEFDAAIKRIEPLLEGLQEGVVEPSGA